ncbi:hypothetical protein A2U01_0096023, partial [Trifolium medium]|nr:hypothetical protein [Trifolium medium]
MISITIQGKGKTLIVDRTPSLSDSSKSDSDSNNKKQFNGTVTVFDKGLA